MTLESPIQTKTRQALEAAGVKCQVLTSGKLPGTYYRLCKDGTPDILCIHPYGWVEMKRPKGRTSPKTLEAQRKFRGFCQRRGIPHIQTDNPKEAVSYILSHGWKSGHMPV